MKNWSHALLVGLALALYGCQSGAALETANPPVRTGTPATIPTSAPTPSIASTLPPTRISTFVIPIVVRDAPGPLYTKVFEIPIGEPGVTYSGVDVPEMERAGPTAFVVAPDGSFYVADTVSARVLRYDPKGELLGIINLSDRVAGIGDLATIGSDVVVLDIAAMVPRVLRCSADGHVLARYELPVGMRLENGLSGMATGDDGEVLIELEGGATVYQLIDAAGNYAPQRLAGRTHGGRLYRVAFPYLFVDDTRIEFGFTSRVGGLYFLAANADGSFYVVQELVRGNKVDQTVHYFNAEGHRLGIAQVPLEEQFVYVPHGLAVGPEGTVYAMLTRREHVEIAALNFFTP